MPLLLDTSRSASTNEIYASNCVTIGLVNNMPDPALEATERQFVDLIRVAASMRRGLMPRSLYSAAPLTARVPHPASASQAIFLLAYRRLC